MVKTPTISPTPGSAMDRLPAVVICLVLALLLGAGAAPCAAGGLIEEVAEDLAVGEAEAVMAGERPATEGGADGKTEAAAPPPTPEAEAAKAAEEHRLKREQERVELLREAEEFVDTADEQVRKLPYPLNILFGETFFGIPLWRYAATAALFFLWVVVLIFFLRYIRRVRSRLDREDPRKPWKMGVEVALIALRNPMKLIVPGLLLRGCSHLVVTPYHPDIVWVSNLLVFLGFTMFFFDLVGIIDKVYGDRIFHTSDRLVDTIRPMILAIVRILILIVAGMQIYQSVTGQTMFSVLAGLGLGGLALALASQETLKNLLGFASIAFDKAFLVGDPVAVADYEGVVEHVGMRSLRIRTYDGNRVIIPNANAINSNIVNLNRRPYIRRTTRIHLSPLNSHDKIVEAMERIRAALDTHDGKLPGKPPVVRFAEYEPARFVIQAMFWYDASLPDFYDECSRINLAICKQLSEAGVIYAER